MAKRRLRLITGLTTILSVLATLSGTSASVAATSFQVGVTHTQTTADYGETAALAGAKSILKTVGPLQNQHIMGWGADNPEPSPGVFDWESLDVRMALIKETTGTPVLTLCGAPDWMKGGTAGETDWDRLEVAPTAAHYDDFANLAVEVAKRYPTVRYFQVWNEFKGFWDDTKNRWNYEGYTALYNKVYAKLKAYNPAIQVGGPYLSVNIYKDANSMSNPSDLRGDWGVVDQRDLDAIQYWLDHKTGAEFIDLDTWASTNDGYYPPAASAGAPFKAITQWLVARTTLPIWWAEFYAPTSASSEASSPAAIKAAIEGMRDGGASVALFWGPECDGSGAPCLWTSTKTTTGGKATTYLPVIKAFSAR
jgi:hypothetical protein